MHRALCYPPLREYARNGVSMYIGYCSIACYVRSRVLFWAEVGGMGRPTRRGIRELGTDLGLVRCACALTRSHECDQSDMQRAIRPV